MTATGQAPERPVGAATGRYDFAAEVSAVLTWALARDDERRRHRCPVCGRRLHEDALS